MRVQRFTLAFLRPDSETRNPVVNRVRSLVCLDEGFQLPGATQSNFDELPSFLEARENISAGTRTPCPDLGCPCPAFMQVIIPELAPPMCFRAYLPPLPGPSALTSILVPFALTRLRIFLRKSAENPTHGLCSDTAYRDLHQLAANAICTS